MIGTLLIVTPIITAIFCYIMYKRTKYYNNWDLGAIISFLFSLLIIGTASAVYINTSMKPTVRSSIQDSLDRARALDNQYELAMIQKEVIEFNKYLELDQKFWHKHFKLWINDDILELEPIN
jgi:hypothetical protein